MLAKLSCCTVLSASILSINDLLAEPSRCTGATLQIPPLHKLISKHHLRIIRLIGERRQSQLALLGLFCV